MSNPMPPMRQVMRSRESSIMRAWKESMARPVDSAVTSTAAAPSPNTRNDSIVSRSSVCCMCSEHSSTLTTSTFAAGSERTMWWASLRPLMPAKQPMKPTWVRSAVVGTPHCFMISKSIPGV